MPMILSIDGGGCLGCGPVRLLAQLEADGVNIHDDVLAGTSVGGLLALLRATGRTWMETEQEFAKWAPKIFAEAPWWWRADPTRPKYEDDGIKAAVGSLFGSMRMCDLPTPVFITSFDFQNLRPKIWDITDTDLVSEVALRTSAAPTYFQPRESRWADGALATNNPSLVGVAGAIAKLGKKLDQLSVMSLATGGSFAVDPHIGRRTTKLGWAEPVIEATMEGGEELMEFINAQIMGGRHLRLDPDCKRKYPLDGLGNMREFRALWQDLYNHRKFEIITFVQTGRLP